MQTFDSTATANVHYIKYDRKKKSGRNYSSNASSMDRKCDRCGYSFEKEHMMNCPAKDVEYQFCSLKGHFAKCCGKAGNFPKGNRGHKVQDTSKKDDSTLKKNLHAIQAVQENANAIEYWDEDRNLKVQEIPKENYFYTEIHLHLHYTMVTRGSTLVLLHLQGYIALQSYIAQFELHFNVTEVAIINLMIYQWVLLTLQRCIHILGIPRIMFHHGSG